MRSRVRRSAGARGVRCVCSRGEAGAWTCGIRPGRAPRRYGAPIALEAMKAMRSGPISRVLSRTIIYLVCALPRSSPHATRARAGPAHGAPIRACSGRGLPSRRVATTLVVSYTTVSAFLSPAEGGQRESSFLRRYPSGRPAWPLASFLPCGARTFLTPIACAMGRAIVWPASQ